MDVLRVLVYLSFLLFPLGAVVRIPLIGSSYFYPVDIPIFLINMYLAYKIFKKEIILTKLPFVKSYGLFVMVCILSLLLNLWWLRLSEAVISGLYIARIVFYANIVIAFQLMKKEIKRFTVFLAISGFVTVIAGFIQYAYYQNLRNLFYLGWDDHLYRLFSTFLDPNFAGAIFVLEILLLLSLLLQTIKLPSSMPSKSRDLKNRHPELVSGSILYRFRLKPGMTDRNFRSARTGIIIIGIFLTLVALLLTYSRSSFIMLIASTIIFFILVKKAGWLFAVGLLLIIGIVLVPKDFHIENMNPLRTVSVLGRFDSYKNALIIFQKSPIYGIGFNAYRFAQRKYHLLDAHWEVTHAGAGVSNSYLFVLATTGVVGLTLFLNFWYRVLRLLFDERKNSQTVILANKVRPESRKDPGHARMTIRKKNQTEGNNNYYFSSAVIASIIGVGVHSLFENTLFYPFVMIWIFLILGMIKYPKNETKRQKTFR